MLGNSYKEIQQNEVGLGEAYAKQIHSEISTIQKNVRFLVDDVTKKFEHEQAARDGAINTLKREMIILMEISFEDNFTRRILIALHSIQKQLSTIQKQLDFTSFNADDRIFALEDE